MEKIKIGIIGIGNCASALLQGIEYYKDKDIKETVGLMHYDIGGYKPYDIRAVAAFDIDKRKVGKGMYQRRFFNSLTAPQPFVRTFRRQEPSSGWAEFWMALPNT